MLTTHELAKRSHLSCDSGCRGCWVRRGCGAAGRGRPEAPPLPSWPAGDAAGTCLPLWETLCQWCHHGAAPKKKQHITYFNAKFIWNIPENRICKLKVYKVLHWLKSNDFKNTFFFQFLAHIWPRTLIICISFCERGQIFWQVTSETAQRSALSLSSAQSLATGPSGKLIR